MIVLLLAWFFRTVALGRAIVIRNVEQQELAVASSGTSVDIDVERLMHLLLAMQASASKPLAARMAMKAPRPFTARRTASIKMATPPVAELIRLMPSFPPIRNGIIATQVAPEAFPADRKVDASRYLEGEILYNGSVSVTFTEVLTKGRLLVGTEAGAVLILNENRDPATLLEGFTPSSLMDCCIGEREDKLHIIGSGSLWRCTLERDLNEYYPPDQCTQMEAVRNLDSVLKPESALYSVACDTTGNLYVGTSEGLLVVSEFDEILMQVKTSDPVTEVRFDPDLLSRLYFRAGDSTWQLDTDSFGDMPLSPLADRAMIAAKETVQIHEGW